MVLRLVSGKPPATAYATSWREVAVAIRRMSKWMATVAAVRPASRIEWRLKLQGIHQRAEGHPVQPSQRVEGGQPIAVMLLDLVRDPAQLKGEIRAIRCIVCHSGRWTRPGGDHRNTSAEETRTGGYSIDRTAAHGREAVQPPT